MSLRLAQQYLTKHTELTEKNNLNFMNPSAVSYLLIYGRPAVYYWLQTHTDRHRQRIMASLRDKKTSGNE